MKIMPTMGQTEFDGLAKAGMKLYAANGYTMAQEGRSIAPVDQSWMRLAEKREMLIDVVSYPDISGNENLSVWTAVVQQENGGWLPNRRR